MTRIFLYMIYSVERLSIYLYNMGQCRIMLAKNQIVVILGVLVLLATATIAAASYNVQTVKAAANPSPFGQVIKPLAQCAQTNTCSNLGSGTQTNWGGVVSTAAQNPVGGTGGNGLGDFRANGCKITQVSGGCSTLPP